MQVLLENKSPYIRDKTAATPMLRSAELEPYGRVAGNCLCLSRVKYQLQPANDRCVQSVYGSLKILRTVRLRTGKRLSAQTQCESMLREEM
jgi:hypothetical protein